MFEYELKCSSYETARFLNVIWTFGEEGGTETIPLKADEGPGDEIDVTIEVGGNDRTFTVVVPDDPICGIPVTTTTTTQPEVTTTTRPDIVITIPTTTTTVVETTTTVPEVTTTTAPETTTTAPVVTTVPDEPTTTVAATTPPPPPPAPPANPPSLPSTGPAEAMQAAGIALLLLGAGSGLLMLARRKPDLTV